MKLNPWYVSGLIDGEGCFSLFLNTENTLRKSGSISQYTYWITVFKVSIRADDAPILIKLKEYFNCGTVNIINDANKIYGTAYFTIRSRKDIISKVVPHFDNFPLQAKKRSSYIAWKKAVLILNSRDMARKTPFEKQGISIYENKVLIAIKEQMANQQVGGQKLRSLNSVINKKYGKVIINKVK